MTDRETVQNAIHEAMEVARDVGDGSKSVADGMAAHLAATDAILAAIDRPAPAPVVDRDEIKKRIKGAASWRVTDLHVDYVRERYDEIVTEHTDAILALAITRDEVIEALAAQVVSAGPLGSKFISYGAVANWLRSQKGSAS